MRPEPGVYSLQRRIAALEAAVDTLKRALVDQARMLRNANEKECQCKKS